MKTGTDNKGNGGFRKSAEERREQILEAAVSEFAARGLRGASVEGVAEKVGVSQPYVYRLFGTKKDLFLAAMERVRERIRHTFSTAVGSEVNGGNALEAMGSSYNLSLLEREEMMLVLQSVVASEDADVREAAGRNFAEMWRYVQGTTGSSDEEVWEFFGAGMMLTIEANVGFMERLGKEEWLGEYMDSGG